jgi:hypothetical protein
MTLSEIQNIAVLAERACAAAANYPNNEELREHLYDAARPVVNLGSETTQRTPLISFTYFDRQRCGQI